MLRVTLRKSPIGYNRKVRDVLRGLGLRKMHQSVTRKDCPPIRGMIFKVKHMVEVEEGVSATTPKETARKKIKEAPVKESAAEEKPAKKSPTRRATAKKSPVRETPARKPQSEKS
jgi:large subunit ribosomal protein L30